MADRKPTNREYRLGKLTNCVYLLYSKTPIKEKWCLADLSDMGEHGGRMQQLLLAVETMPKSLDSLGGNTELLTINVTLDAVRQLAKVVNDTLAILEADEPERIKRDKEWDEKYEAEKQAKKAEDDKRLANLCPKCREWGNVRYDCKPCKLIEAKRALAQAELEAAEAAKAATEQQEDGNILSMPESNS